MCVAVQETALLLARQKTTDRLQLLVEAHNLELTVLRSTIRITRTRVYSALLQEANVS